MQNNGFQGAIHSPRQWATRKEPRFFSMRFLLVSSSREVGILETLPGSTHRITAAKTHVKILTFKRTSTENYSGGFWKTKVETVPL